MAGSTEPSTDDEQALRFGREHPRSEAHALALPGVAIPKRLTTRTPALVAAATLFTCGLYAVPWIFHTAADANRARLGPQRIPAFYALFALCTFLFGSHLFLILLARDVQKMREPSHAIVEPSEIASAAPPETSGRTPRRTSHELAAMLPWISAIAIVVPPLLVVALAVAQAMMNAVALEALELHHSPEQRSE